MRPAGDGVGNLQGVLVEFARDNPSAQKHCENRDGYPKTGRSGPHRVQSLDHRRAPVQLERPAN